MKINRAGLDLIKQWEGLKLQAYPDPGTGGEPWTIGYGTTSAAGVGKITKGMTITEELATEWLLQSLAKYETAVSKALTNFPNENQFSAMVSLCYNIGPGAFPSSSIAKRFNAGDVQGAADAFRLWNKANGKVLPGLVRRREDERALFLKPVEAPVPPPVIEDPTTVPRQSFWAWLKALFSRG